LDKTEVQLGFDLLDDRVFALPTEKFIDGESQPDIIRKPNI